MKIWSHPAGALAGVALALLALGACTEDKPAGDVEVACRASEECASDPAGNLCLGGACVGCGSDAQCVADPAYGAGALCVAGRCEAPEDECTPGEPGCEEACTPGELGCACASGGACQGSAVCQGEVCTPCSPGSQGCACAEGDLCLGELTCQAGVCAPPGCPAGTEGCACAEGERCEGDGVVCAEGLCRPCPNDMDGCPCVEGACGEELYCEGERCYAPVECEGDGCGEGRLCGGDGTVCLDACAEGYSFDAELDGCVDLTPGCTPAVSEGCAARSRVCVEEEGVGRCAGCVDGFLEEDGACRALVTCEALGCARQNRSCNPEAPGQDATCAGCVDGFLEEDGACRAQQTCAALGCAAQNRGCTPEAPGQDAACGGCAEGFLEEDGACRAQLTCAALGCDSIHRVCSPEAPGQDAACLGCAEGFLEEDGLCRAIMTCESLGCAGQNRGCNPHAPGQDATCGGCAMGFLEEDGACVPDLRATCNEDVNDSNSILDECAGQRRACVAAEQGASCGECLDGFLENPETLECLTEDEFPACEGVGCPEGRDCIALRNGGALHCLPPPCPEGQTWNLLRQSCQSGCDCAIPEGEEESSGLTGRVWPVTDRNGDCVCETREGFFFNASTGFRRVEPCDGDGDGWVRRSVFDFVQPNADPALRQNARCALREVDQFLLINEFGQRYEVPVSLITNGALLRLVLYELDEGDDEQGQLDGQEEPARGRRFRAAESNPLTRACVSANADLNHNAVSDLREHQRSMPGVNSLAWMLPFVRMSYFVELHTGWYEPAESGPGRFVIRERARCEEGFPVDYDAADGPYWQQCSRRRDARYEPLAPVNYDFGEWSCIESRGACPVAPPPTDATPQGAIPAHGVCEDRLGDGPLTWRGMNHASQFRCVEVISDEQQQDVLPFHVRAGQLRAPLHPAGREHLNLCGPLDCAESGDPECQDVQASGDDGPNPQSPVIACQSEALLVANDPPALVGQVGWAAKRYVGYERAAQYDGGCIDESAEWPFLCPGFDPNTPERTDSQGATGNFGRLLCGCGFNYGGFDCEVGCPDALLHYGGARGDDEGFCRAGYCTTLADEDGLDGGRSGYWMCGDFNNTAPVQVPGQEPILQGGGFELRGFIPTQGTTGAPLCQAFDQDGRCVGFTVH